MSSDRDGHIRVLPLHVANKIAAGEVVERPASVVKELVENAIDAGASRIAVNVVQGGRKLVAVQDDGCGMCRDDALLSLERQATSKIHDVDDIERIDTLGFRGEAIPSIASVSRFTITTRRRESDEGVLLQVNAGTIAEIRAAGCPPGTLVEVRDLFCNVPARRKFLRSFATEEAHVKQVFTVHALAHPATAFLLTVNGRELYRLAPAATAADRVRDLFGPEFMEALTPLAPSKDADVSVSGYIERPNLSSPTRREQYIFVNGRPATSSSIAYAMREAYPRRQGDSRPAVIMFIELPPSQVDVNVHPTKREVRFRDNTAVKRAIAAAIERAIVQPHQQRAPTPAPEVPLNPTETKAVPRAETAQPDYDAPLAPRIVEAAPQPAAAPVAEPVAEPASAPVETELPLAAADGGKPKPWAWFRFLATTASGYLLIETDSGVVTINPHAARERIAFEKLQTTNVSQSLLIPETVHLAPHDFARISASLGSIESMGFKLEPFGRDTFKVDAIPAIVEGLSSAGILATIARDLADGQGRRGSARWREELVARSVAKSFAGMSLALTEEGAVKLVEELASCRMPYVCPRGKPVMIFTSTRELNRKFACDRP